MALQFDKNEYQIPRGRVFFDPLDANDQYTGEIYLGNCPGVTINIATEKADHYSSESGLAEKDSSLNVKVTRAGQVNCDNFSSRNTALFLSGERSTVSQTSATVTAEVHTVEPGRFYQLGASPANPPGARNVSAITVKNSTGVTTYAPGTDYNVDLALGRIQIVEDGTIVAGDIKVDYTRPAATWARIKSGSKSELSGALRVVQDNPNGKNRDWYMPLTSLTPSGEFPLVTAGDDQKFATMQFALEVLKPANGEAIYADGRPVAV